MLRLAGRGHHVTGNDVTWPQVIGSDPEVTSFHRKSPGSGCRRPKTGGFCAFHFLQGCTLQEEAVTWQKITSRDFRWAEVIRKRHFTGSHLEMVVEDRKLVYTVRLTSYKAVDRRRQSHDRKWCHVISGDRKWRHFTGNHLEVAVEGRILAYNVRFTSYKAVTHMRRQSRDTNDVALLGWPEVTQKWSHLSESHLEMAVEGRRTGVYCAFDFLQGCSSQEEAVTWQEMTWRDLRCPEVTRKWRHLPGSHLE